MKKIIYYTPANPEYMEKKKKKRKDKQQEGYKEHS
jgi:hypothetical protein